MIPKKKPEEQKTEDKKTEKVDPMAESVEEKKDKIKRNSKVDIHDIFKKSLVTKIPVNTKRLLWINKYLFFFTYKWKYQERISLIQYNLFKAFGKHTTREKPSGLCIGVQILVWLISETALWTLNWICQP